MQCLLLPWLMFEFSFNSNAPALGFNIGVRHQRRTPENRFLVEALSRYHGLHGSRYADIY
jgi:hypothetical protein